MRRFALLRALALAVAVAATALAPAAASAQAPIAAPSPAPVPSTTPYSASQLVNAGQNFFGQVAGNVATVIERAVSQFGLPNGYILGTTTGGAILFGLRYGQGTLYTQNQGTRPVYWQGPSLGFDVGGDVSQTMMLVYGLPSIEALYDVRFFGVGGSAYVVGGVGMTVLTGEGMTLVPIVSGVGARLGVNLGYLKFTRTATGNPF